MSLELMTMMRINFSQFMLSRNAVVEEIEKKNPLEFDISLTPFEL